MSRCPTDRPVLKSILQLYRPTADCLPSLSLSLVLFQHSITFHLFFFTPTATYLLNLSLSLSSPMSISLPLLCPISFSFTFSSSFRSYLCGPIQPAFLLFFRLSRFLRTNHSVSSHALCVSLTVFLSLSSLFFSPRLTLSRCSLSGS